MWNRLVEPLRVKALYQQGKKVVCPEFILRLGPCDGQCSRFAVHMRKAFGNAVSRNRMKRVVRAAVAAIALDDPLDLIVSPRRRARGLSSVEATEIIKRQLRKLSRGVAYSNRVNVS